MKRLARISVWLSRLEMPALTMELRGQMRGARAFAVMFAYVTVLGLAAVCGLAWLMTGGARTAHGVVVGGPFGALGHDLYLALAAVQLGLVMLLSPAMTCGSLTGERENRSLEMLALTTISSGNILLGKLLGSLCYVGLLVICGLPIFALTLMLGGVSPLEILFADLVAAGVGLLFGALGLLVSALVHRTYLAAALAYGGMAVLAVALPLSAVNGILLLLVGGLILSGLLAGAARWGIPHFRPNWRPERVVYIAIFGLSYCAMVGLMNTPVLQILEHFFRASPYLSPFQLLTVPTTAVVLTFGALTFLGAGAALFGAISLFRVMRAPQPDSLEVQARVARELRPHLVREEAAL